MRLLRLRIGRYRVIDKLKIDFAPMTATPSARDALDYSLDFLVGVNGTGKSTVLRALGEIFQRLDGNTQLAQFPFEVEYTLDNPERRISISNVRPETEEVLPDKFIVRRGSLSGRAMDTALEVDSISRGDLPDTIIAYTTGSESEWEKWQIPDPFGYGNRELVDSLSVEEQVIKELPGHLQLPSPVKDAGKPLLFVRKDDLSLVALCGLLADLTIRSSSASTGVLDEVLKATKIQRLCGFSLRFRMNQTPPDHEGIQQRLGQYATRIINVGAEYLLVFDFSRSNNAKEILDESGGALSLLQFLVSLAGSGPEKRILAGVNIFLERPVVDGALNPELPPLHLFDWLSDGEQTFLGRMCLFTLFGESDALILLDEPEVHFNDYWKRRVVHHIDRVFAASKANTSSDSVAVRRSSHILISTHSSIALSDVYSQDIFRLERDGIRTDREPRPRSRPSALIRATSWFTSSMHRSRAVNTAQTTSRKK